MKIAAIKKAVETYSLEQLREAEDAILNEIKPLIDIEGVDEGEQLTHAMAAIWVLNEMQDKKMDFNTALREYTKKVRISIS